MKKNYPISGTFIDEITYDIPTSNWTKKEWSKDLDYMKKVGIDTVILIRGGFNNKCIYPSEHFPHYVNQEDFLGMILSLCDKKNMNVFIGMYITNLCWNDGDADGEIEKNKLFVDEVYEKYSHHKSFYGWYIPHEVGNDVFNITKVFSGLSKIAKDKDPSKKVLISPFFYMNTDVIPKDEILSPEGTYEEWDKMLKVCSENIDIASFQDGVKPVEKQAEYFDAVKRAFSKYNIELWSNIELFDAEMRGFYPITFSLLNHKAQTVKPYVSKFITFEFSHFLSPQSIFPSARNLYKKYKKYYKKESFR